MKILHSFLIISTLVLIACQGRKNPRGFTAYYRIKIVRVISGDSLIAEQLNGTGKQLPLRLAQISSPHLNQSYGLAAKEHLEKLLKNVKGKKVGILVQDKDFSSDKLFVRLYVGRRNTNIKMLYDGFAWCNKNEKCPFKYKMVMKMAKIRKLGLWKDKKPIPPWDWNKSSTANKRNASSRKGSILVTLNRVVDGDTVYVIRQNSKDKSIIKVRMTGIDSPEMKQTYGPEAKNHLQTILSNLSDKSLLLVIEGTDRYKRTLGVIKSGSIDVNKKMVEDGYAWCYRHTDCPESYMAATKKAKENRKGLFVQDKPVAPWEWRKQQKE